MIILLILIAIVVLELRRVPHGLAFTVAGIVVYVFWPLIRFLTITTHGLFLPAIVLGPLMYLANVQKREEALADAARRRAIREQYREIGL